MKRRRVVWLSVWRAVSHSLWRTALPCLALLWTDGDLGAAEPMRLTPDAAYRELASSGSLSRVTIEGDLDIARLRAPAARKRVELRGVVLEGALRLQGEGPALEIVIETSTLQALDLRGARLRAGFALENSEVVGFAQFDDAQFDGPFSLHGSTLSGRATFRRARFAGPVEIVAARFADPPGLRGGISFSDAQFAGPARFDRSQFASDVRFDSARFMGDASFLGLVVGGRASLRNVLFARDAEFRFCRLGDVDFGDAEQMSVFAALGDFRGCTMRSARFDYVDWRGDAMLVNMQVTSGDLSFREAALRGGRSDFSGLKVAGRLDLAGAHITALHFQWPELAAPLLRAAPTSDVLRPLQVRLETLKQDDDAREAFAALSEQERREGLARTDLDPTEKARLWIERVLWGWPTGYGTRLGRIAALSLAAWLLLSLPLLLSPKLRIGSLSGALDKAPPRHLPVTQQELTPGAAGWWAARLRQLGYSFGLMFATPGFRLRPTEPVSGGMRAYLLALRGFGGLLLALLALTLTKVSPVFQAIVGKVTG